MKKYGEMIVVDFDPEGHLNDKKLIVVTEILTGHVHAITGIVGNTPIDQQAREFAFLISKAPQLLEKAKLVVALWEKGDLAEAVSDLGYLISEIEVGVADEN